MRTLTITEAKKNLSKWLQAAARGEEVAIISGAEVIALRKVEVEATDYAWREYGATPAELERFDDAMEARYQRLKKSGKAKPVALDELKSKLGL